MEAARAGRRFYAKLGQTGVIALNARTLGSSACCGLRRFLPPQAKLAAAEARLRARFRESRVFHCLFISLVSHRWPPAARTRRTVRFF
jgi:hypothetical protein